MVRLHELPEEVGHSQSIAYLQILLEIHLLSLSPFLPLAHPVIYSNLHHAPKSHVARYLLRLYEEYGPNELLVRAVRHPVCNSAVAQEIQKLWDQQSTRQYKRNGRNRAIKHSPVDIASLTCSELPRRLFRSTTADTIHPLLKYLMDTYSPSPNSHKGYPLCRAVITSNIDLIEYLLQHDADPAAHGALPVRIATQRGRLDLVKLLVEPRTPEHSPAKKIKRMDRFIIGSDLVELAMKSGHEHIVRYYVHDKGEYL
jgi:hypothetical protein